MPPIKCCECQKQFSSVYNLRKHARKYHSDKVDVIVPKKTYNYQCTQCQKNFTQLKNFNYHRKTHEHQNVSCTISSKHTNSKCPICNLEGPKVYLVTHFQSEHNINCKTQVLEFDSLEKFSAWKIEMEHNTKSKYILERGSQSSKNGMTVIKYRCHRSGKYATTGKNLRHLKSQGSNKIGGFCPACLKLVIDKNKLCKVSFVDQHVGHECDLGHLFLTSHERESLANKMAQGIPFTEILDDVRGSVAGSQLDRIHLLSRKDLYNIEKSFHLESSVVHHENDAISVDACVKQRESSDYVLFYEPQDVEFENQDLIKEDFENPNSFEVDGILTDLNQESVSGLKNAKENEVNQLIKEKQKIIESFTHLVESSVDSMEQLDAVKKLCSSLEPTLTAIAMRQTEKFTSLRLSPGNKKIIPQRGKLHSTKKKTARKNRRGFSFPNK